MSAYHGSQNYPKKQKALGIFARSPVKSYVLLLYILLKICKEFVRWIFLIITFCIVILQILARNNDHRIISGNYSFYNQPFTISAFPFVNITTSCFYGKCRFLTIFLLLREFAGSVHISLTCCLIAIYLNQNIRHHMMGRYHVAMLVQHVINKLSSGSLRECWSIVHLAVFSKHTVTQFIVDSIQSTTICIDLIAPLLLIMFRCLCSPCLLSPFFIIYYRS